VELASSTETIEHVAIELPVEPQSAAEARAAISPLRHRANASSFDDVRLLLSELVADALATKPRPANAAINLEAQALGGVTRVTVTFDSLRLRLPTQKPRPAEPGWGVYLVQTLATRWGARRTANGTYVWFEG
jgi:hypothetical protein